MNALTKFGFTAFLVLLTIATLGYLLPTAVAFMRGHPHRWPIFCLNFFLGWVVIGWVGGLVWAVWPLRQPAPAAA